MTEIQVSQPNPSTGRSSPTLDTRSEPCQDEKLGELDRKSDKPDEKPSEQDGVSLQEKSKAREDDTIPLQGDSKAREDDAVPPPEETAATQDWTLFSDSTISFAIDTSGSTLGGTLAREQQAILDISATLSNTAKDAARVLPWSSHADQVMTLSGLPQLTSYGGTDPGALLYADSCLAALQNSSLWFLITDGEIPEFSLHRFASGLSSSRLHGTACVIIVFGTPRGRPSDCNISVGVSVFAVVPDCLFLFMDTHSDRCYLLQCKGTFTEILEKNNHQQPELDDNTRWDDLPRISLDDLGCVRVPKHRDLKADEIYLNANLVINLVDLFAGRITDKEVIDAILDSPEHIRTVTMTAQTRGLEKQLREWVIKQELDPSDLLSADAPKVNESTSRSVSTLMQKMTAYPDLPRNDQEISRLQAEIRAANSARSSSINATWVASSAKVASRHHSIQSAVVRSKSSVTHARQLSMSNSNDFYQDDDNTSSDDDDEDSVPMQRNGQLLSTPGFQLSISSGGQFQGTCPLCDQNKATLSLLLREPPQSQGTDDFPAIDSKSNLAFPLAMGNFRETDIICPLLYCDACSYTIQQTSGQCGEDKIKCTLPLVSYATNKKAYNQQLQLAFENRFDETSTPLVFVAVLCTTLQRIDFQKNKSSRLLADALLWSCRNIILSIPCPSDMTWSLNRSSDMPDSKPLKQVLIKSCEDAVRATSVSYFHYPIEGFVVATRLLNQIEQRQPQIQNTAKKAVFQRLLFHITEQYDKQINKYGRILVHVTMARLLILERNRRSRGGSILGEKQLSFRGIAGLTRNIFGDRKSLRDKLAISFDDLIAASLLETDFLKAFKKLGSLYDWVESASGHAVAIFVHYLYRYNTASWESSDAHYLDLATTPTLAPVFLEPSEISAGKAERLIGKLPPFDTIGEALE